MRPNFNENFAKKILMNPVNSAQNLMIDTQIQLKGTLSSIQTHARSYPL